MARFLALALFGALLAFAPFAVRAQTTGIVVSDAWARASMGFVKTSAVYLTIVNGGPTVDKLVAASTPVADKAEAHIMLRDGDIMRMRRVIGVDVPPGSKTVFSPNSFHIMLTGLHAPLKVGDQFPLALQFANAGLVNVTVMVRK
jgi:periplasmic copper chaperone A